MEPIYDSVYDLLRVVRKIWCEGYFAATNTDPDKLSAKQMAETLEAADLYFERVYRVRIPKEPKNES